MKDYSGRRTNRKLLLSGRCVCISHSASALPTCAITADGKQYVALLERQLTSHTSFLPAYVRLSLTAPTTSSIYRLVSQVQRRRIGIWRLLLCVLDIAHFSLFCT